MVAFLCIMFFIGAMFGSFSSVLIERWHSGKKGILLWRSECPQCHNTLTARELIPIFSYIFQWGKCKNCRTKIPFFYPLLEISFGILFVIISWALLSLWYMPSNATFIYTLFLTWVVGVYMFYDIRFREIPDEVMLPAIYTILLFFIIGIFEPKLIVFFDKHTYDTFPTLIADHIFWGIILYTFFYLQILIPGWYFLLKRKSYAEFWDLIILYILLPFEATKELFQKWFTKKRVRSSSKKEEHIPTWIGGGDLRIAIFTWLTLWIMHGAVSFFIAYLLWAIYGCVFLLWKRIRNEPMISEVPFWPFLWLWWILTVLFHSEIIEYFYTHILF